MSLALFYAKFPTQQSCVDRIEKIRWQRYGPRCPLCRSPKVGKKKENAKVGRWNCYRCKSSFTVMSGTIFHSSKVPLQKWFCCIDIVLNGTRELSSHELAEHLEVHQKTALVMQRKIAEEVDGGGANKLREYIGSSKRRFVRRIYKRQWRMYKGKRVIT